MGQQPGSMPRSAREKAVAQLVRVEAQGAYVGLSASADPLDVPDARTERHTTEYVAGVTRWRRRLDFLLATYYQGNFEGLEPLLRQILRVGAYDFLFLQTASYAAVHESVELAKRLVRPAAGRLVNGVLRALLRDAEMLPVPQTGDATEDLAIRWSHPSWMVRRWLERYGLEATEALLEWNNRRPAYGLRVVEDRIGRDEFLRQAAALDESIRPSAYLDDFVRVGRLQPFFKSGLVGSACTVQDESAGLVVRLLDPLPGEFVVDACAAPGGKALYSAARMKNRGRMAAVDLHPHRLDLIAGTAQRLGVTLLDLLPGDFREKAASGRLQNADRVLVDAPCSGLGVLAKRADLRWNRQESDLAGLTALQDSLLDAAAAVVRPGGVLLYSTCTIEPEENEDRVRAFLGRHPEYRVEPATAWIPPTLVTTDGFYATLPHRDGIDGAFGARMRRIVE